MTQRARNHDTNVYARQADDALWALWKSESKTGHLTLPCCGGTAVPREHPETGTRFFSHAPYAARTCEWKATGALHEELVHEACRILDQIGWTIETDCWLNTVAIDILASHPEKGDQVAIMFETGAKSDRPDDTLLAENKALQETGLRSAVWFVPFSRYGTLESQLLSLPYRRTDTYSENTLRTVADLLHTWFERIDEIAPMGMTGKNERKRLRDIDPPYETADKTDTPVSSPPTQVDEDPEWLDGSKSVGSPRARSDRLTRLAHRWLGKETAYQWLRTDHPDLGAAPLDAARISVGGYLQAQDALKVASFVDEKQITLDLE